MNDWETRQITSTAVHIFITTLTKNKGWKGGFRTREMGLFKLHVCCLDSEDGIEKFMLHVWRRVRKKLAV